MDEAIARLVVQTYVDGWCEGKRAKIVSSLDEECIIIAPTVSRRPQKSTHVGG